jgi:Fic family protein
MCHQTYELLQRVRTEGIWETWLEFFLTGILETAFSAVIATKAMLSLFATDRERIETLGRGAVSAARIHQLLQRQPLLNVGQITTTLKLSMPTINKAIAQLETLGVVREVTKRQRDRLWVYSRYLELLAQGTEPL